MAKSIIQVREWEGFSLPAERDTPQFRERLLLAGQTTAGPALRLAGRRLYARDLVGIIDAGFVQVQIVPKIYEDDTDEEGALSLCDLLLHCGLPVKPSILPARVREGRLAVIEGLYKHIADECGRLLMRGIPRRYWPVEEMAQVIRGRIQLNQMMLRRSGEQHLMPIRYAPLHQDNPLSRTIRALCERLAGLTRVGRTRLAFEQYAELLHSAARCRLSPSLVNSVRLSRLEREWTVIIECARMLAGGSLPDVLRSGRSHGFSLLFGIDSLFEAIIRRAIGRALADTALCVRGSRSAGFLLRRQADGAEAFLLKPDLLIETVADGAARIVADVKWKSVTGDAAGLGIPRDDIYQLLAYMDHLSLKKGLLVLPRTKRSDALLTTTPYSLVPGDRTIQIVRVALEPLLRPQEQDGMAGALRALLTEMLENHPALPAC